MGGGGGSESGTARPPRYVVLMRRLFLIKQCLLTTRALSLFNPYGSIRDMQIVQSYFSFLDPRCDGPSMLKFIFRNQIPICLGESTINHNFSFI